MKRSILILLAAISVTALVIVHDRRAVKPNFHEGRSLKALIHTESIPDIGYQYDLLQRFASSMGATMEIRPVGSSYLDSLLLGNADIVVCAQADTLVWTQIDSSAIWLTADDDPRRIAEIEQWKDAYVGSATDDSLRTLFSTPLRPHRMAASGIIRDGISPYDSLMRIHADSLGWDWRLIAAIAYQESRFNINAGSARGARGLMQLMPRTRSSYGCDNYLDPEQNIAAATKLLAALQQKFRGSAANQEELVKFTLAAYNAGDSRIRQYMEIAAQNGMDASRWDSVAAAVSADAEPLTTETISFVRRVLSYYDCFRQICPGE